MVWVHGRDQQSGDTIAREIGGQFIQADLEDASEVASLARLLSAASGGCLDILVNNAGLEVVMPFPELDLDSLDKMWRVNVRAAVQLTHALLPALRASGSASVINVTSIHQTVAYPQNSAYALSKAALGMFSQTLAVELAPLGIRVNNFSPGAVKTEMNRELIEAMGTEFAE